MANDNPNPIVYQTLKPSLDIDYYDQLNDSTGNKYDENNRDDVTSEEIFELIRHLNDPEHPLTLEQLNVLSIDHIKVDDKANKIEVLFTPTIPHCSMATLIGLCIRVKLLRSLPMRFKVTVKIYPGAHQSEDSINKQLNDKERVAAALENVHLLEAVHKCIAHTDK